MLIAMEWLYVLLDASGAIFSDNVYSTRKEADDEVVNYQQTGRTLHVERLDHALERLEHRSAA